MVLGRAEVIARYGDQWMLRQTSRMKSVFDQARRDHPSAVDDQADQPTTADLERVVERVDRGLRWLVAQEVPDVLGDRERPPSPSTSSEGFSTAMIS